MIQIKIKNREHQFQVALAFSGVLSGRTRHGMVKHIRDNRRAWRKKQTR